MTAEHPHAAALRDRIRSIPDFPKAGIVFRDITTLLQDGPSLKRAIHAMADHWRDQGVDVVLGAEARGFIFGTAVAYSLGCGFVPVRKPGKLPGTVRSAEYELEYGTDALEIHEDALSGGNRVLLVDDLLATGGTMKACCELVEGLGGEVAGCAFLVELAFLNGRDVLTGYDCFSVIRYESEDL